MIVSDILEGWLACKTLAEQKKFASAHNLQIKFYDKNNPRHKIPVNAQNATENTLTEKGEKKDDNSTIVKQD